MNLNYIFFYMLSTLRKLNDMRQKKAVRAISYKLKFTGTSLSFISQCGRVRGFTLNNEEYIDRPARRSECVLKRTIASGCGRDEISKQLVRSSGKMSLSFLSRLKLNLIKPLFIKKLRILLFKMKNMYLNFMSLYH